VYRSAHRIANANTFAQAGSRAPPGPGDGIVMKAVTPWPDMSYMTL